jgi:hypothetical protein
MIGNAVFRSAALPIDCGATECPYARKSLPYR